MAYITDVKHQKMKTIYYFSTQKQIDQQIKIQIKLNIVLFSSVITAQTFMVVKIVKKNIAVQFQEWFTILRLKIKGDMSLVPYCDFETTVAIHFWLDPENKKMFVVTYVIVFAFLLELILYKVI